MKNQILRIAALSLVVTTFAITAHAQNAGNNLRVSIPFDFVIGDKRLPAGDYNLLVQDSGNTMRIQLGDQSTGAYFLIHPVQGLNIQNQSKLVFHKYGDQYFLSQVWTAGRATSQEVNRSSKQRGLEGELAKRSGKTESVAVSMKAN